MLTMLFLNLQIAKSDIRPHINLAVSLEIAYGHFNLPQGLIIVKSSPMNHFGGNFRWYAKICFIDVFGILHTHIDLVGLHSYK